LTTTTANKGTTTAIASMLNSCNVIVSILRESKESVRDDRGTAARQDERQEHPHQDLSQNQHV